jgi:hypothetical protein
MQTLAISRRKVRLAKNLLWGGTAVSLTAVPFLVCRFFDFSNLPFVLFCAGLVTALSGIALSTMLFRCPCCGRVLRRGDVSPVYDIFCFDDPPETCRNCSCRIHIEFS